MKGFVNVIKPEGMNSTKVVSIVKRKFNLPCGHMGTLDPMASGVLPVGIGKTTRLFDYLLDKVKRYRARFVFGINTDTLDTTGTITDRCTTIPTEEEIKAVLCEFIGKIDQIPPKYSSKCINGKRGYQLARSGIDFELKPKTVEILNVELVKKTNDNEYEFIIDCKGGTYIRSIARDLGERLNTFAVMSKLLREKSGYFDLNNGVSLEEFENSVQPEKYVIASDKVIDYKKIVLNSKQATKILNGVFEDLGYNDGLYRVYNQSEFWGIGQSINGILKIKSYVK